MGDQLGEAQRHDQQYLNVDPRLLELHPVAEVGSQFNDPATLFPHDSAHPYGLMEVDDDVVMDLEVTEVGALGHILDQSMFPVVDDEDSGDFHGYDPSPNLQHHYPEAPLQPSTPQHLLPYYLHTPPASKLRADAPAFVPEFSVQITQPADQHMHDGLPTPSSWNSPQIPIRLIPGSTPTTRRSVMGRLDTTPQPVSVEIWADGNRHRTRQPNTLHRSSPGPSGARHDKPRSVTQQSNTSYTCTSEGCGKEFLRKSAMAHHQRYHAERTHSCTLCDSKFHFAKDLKRHMKTHSPEQRHLFCTEITCPYRQKGFQRQDHLNRHIQKVHHRRLASQSSTQSV